MTLPTGGEPRASVAAMLLAAALAGSLLVVGQAVLGALAPSSAAQDPPPVHGTLRSVSFHLARSEAGLLLAVDEVLAVSGPSKFPLDGIRYAVRVEAAAGAADLEGRADGGLKVAVLRDSDGSSRATPPVLGEGDLLQLRLAAPPEGPGAVVIAGGERVGRTLEAPGWPALTLWAEVPKGLAGQSAVSLGP